MSVVEATCVMGGETRVAKRDWLGTRLDKARVWVGAPIPRARTEKGRCVKPESCPVRLYCTGKVRISKPTKRGLPPIVVSELVTVNPTAVDLFDAQSDKDQPALHVDASLFPDSGFF